VSIILREEHILQVFGTRFLKYLHQSILTNFSTHTASYTMGTRNAFLSGKAVPACSWPFTSTYHWD